jgi:hypothetical protein
MHDFVAWDFSPFHTFDFNKKSSLKKKYGNSGRKEDKRKLFCWWNDEEFSYWQIVKKSKKFVKQKWNLWNRFTRWKAVEAFEYSKREKVCHTRSETFLIWYCRHCLVAWNCFEHFPLLADIYLPAGSGWKLIKNFQTRIMRFIFKDSISIGWNGFSLWRRFHKRKCDLKKLWNLRYISSSLPLPFFKEQWTLLYLW